MIIRYRALFIKNKQIIHMSVTFVPVKLVRVDNDHEKLSFFTTALAGAATGSFVMAISQPLDVLKVRFQLQTEPFKKGSKYSSIYQAVRTIVREEGVTALWSGHVPCQLLSISYGLLQFSTYDWLTKKELNILHENFAGANFVKGSMAAAVATIASYPFDTLRTRLVAEMKTKRVYRGVADAFVTMVRTEGVLSLFKGIIPTLCQIAPHAGIQFTVYKWFQGTVLNKIKFLQRYNSTQTSLLGNLISGSIAGCVAKTVIYPFDLVKKRLQIQGFQKYRKDFGKQIYCNGLIECVLKTVREEGVLALYKGYGPSMYKALFISALHFAVYDEIKHFLIAPR